MASLVRWTRLVAFRSRVEGRGVRKLTKNCGHVSVGHVHTVPVESPVYNLKAFYTTNFMESVVSCAPHCFEKTTGDRWVLCMDANINDVKRSYDANLIAIMDRECKDAGSVSATFVFGEDDISEFSSNSPMYIFCGAKK